MSTNYSNLFQSISGGSSNWYADWSSIRNGSYYRLTKAYYSNLNSSSSSSSSKTSKSSNILEQILEERRNPPVSKEVQEANSSLGSKISLLSNSVATLQKKDTYTASENSKDGEEGKDAADKVVSAMKNFVTQYNDTVTTAKKSTLSGKTSNVAAMMKASQADAEKLAEIGVTINRDGTLMLNEGKLKSAGISKVEELFSKDNVISYGSKVASRLKFASSAAGAAESTEKTDKAEETAAASSAAALKADGNKLASDSLYEKVKGKDGNYQYDVEKILSAVKSFAKNYNDMFDAAKFSLSSGVASNLERIREKTAQNKDELEKLGINVDSKGKMTVNEDIFKKADMSQVQKLFKDYGSSVAVNASLVDYYMTTQANVTSGYTANGLYNVQGGIRFNEFV